MAATERRSWSVYIARCSDGSLYTGIAVDVAARIAQHDAGKGARYTRGRGPLIVTATRRCETHGDALRLELAVKALARGEKEWLVAKKGRLARFARKVSLARVLSPKRPTARRRSS